MSFPTGVQSYLANFKGYFYLLESSFSVFTWSRRLKSDHVVKTFFFSKSSLGTLLHVAPSPTLISHHHSMGKICSKKRKRKVNKHYSDQDVQIILSKWDINSRKICFQHHTTQNKPFMSIQDCKYHLFFLMIKLLIIFLIN